MDEMQYFLFYDSVTKRGIFKGMNTVLPENSIVLSMDEFMKIENPLEWVVKGDHAVKSVSLDMLRSARWQLIKQARAAMEFGAFTWNGSVFDSDSESQRRLAAAMQMAALAPPGYRVTWTLANNTTREMTLDDFVGATAKLALDVAGYYDHALKLRELIAAAVSAQAIMAITWATPTP